MATGEFIPTRDLLRRQNNFSRKDITSTLQSTLVDISDLDNITFATRLAMIFNTYIQTPKVLRTSAICDFRYTTQIPPFHNLPVIGPSSQSWNSLLYSSFCVLLSPLPRLPDLDPGYLRLRIVDVDRETFTFQSSMHNWAQIAHLTDCNMLDCWGKWGCRLETYSRAKSLGNLLCHTRLRKA